MFVRDFAVLVAEKRDEASVRMLISILQHEVS